MPMVPTLIDLLLGIALLGGMTLLQMAGHAVARRGASRASDGKIRDLGAVEGAAFGLLALLMGFSFSGAISRFESRRDLIVSEAVSIGSTWQWIDVVNGPARDELRAEFRDYVDTRIEIYRSLSDKAKMDSQIKIANGQQAEIWSLAIAASKEQNASPATTALLSSLNAVFDLATKRFALQRWHVPLLIFVLLIAMALCCSFLAGYSLAKAQRYHWIAIMTFSSLMTITICVILDLEFPRKGIIRLDDFDTFLVEARAAMN